MLRLESRTVQQLFESVHEELSIDVVPINEVWKSVTDWGTALSWWTVEPLQPCCPVAHPIEVQEFFWLSLEDMIAHPDLLPGNLVFLEHVKSWSNTALRTYSPEEAEYLFG